MTEPDESKKLLIEQSPGEKKLSENGLEAEVCLTRRPLDAVAIPIAMDGFHVSSPPPGPFESPSRSGLDAC